MKKIFLTIMCCALVSCENYLDIVPENISKYEDSFQNKVDAEGALYALYSSIPAYPNWKSVIESASDEIMMPTGWSRDWFVTKKVWGGEVSTTNPIYTYWSSSAGNVNYDMYQAIRYCHMFLDNIDAVPDVSEDKLKQWKAEATFLIAYYHFRLLSLYGPVIIVDRTIPIDAPNEEIFIPRSTYDESVKFIVDKFDEAAEILPNKTIDTEFGKPTSVTAKALAARTLLYAASSLYNGNKDYANFQNPDGTQLIDQAFDKDKWKRAMEANLEAINAAHSAGISLYHSDIKAGNEFDQAIIDNRYKIVDPWNQELIWGYSGQRDSQNYDESWQYISGPRTIWNLNRAYNAIAPTFTAIEQYYTANGLPMDEDDRYNYNDRYQVAEKDSTAYLNRNREPRFYSSIGYDRGPYEYNGDTIILHMRAGEIQGKHGTLNDYSPNGYLIKKLAHPQTTVTESQISIVDYPWPIIRLAELYLNYAEAYYEYNGTLDGAALEYFNRIRDRAGIPALEKSWAGKGIDYQKIIRRERMIELMFEYHRFYDLRRWKIAENYLGKVHKGWTVDGESREEFYTLKEDAEFDFTRSFFERNYLHPIPQIDVDANPELINNPGW